MADWSVACRLVLDYNPAGGGIVIPILYALPEFLRAGLPRRPSCLLGSMKTDKELYRIFEVAPEWVFDLAGLPSPGKSTLQSVTIKALERRADGVIVPDAPDQPLTIVEFQFQADDTIYRRTVVEMAAVQDAFPRRVVQGVIFFGYNKLDPQTEPWTKEIEMMLLGELPELEETVAGKELIQIGEKRGLEEGLLAFLAARHGTVPAAIREKIAKLTPAEAKRMMQFLARCQSLDEVTQWLARAKTKGRGSKRGRN